MINECTELIMPNLYFRKTKVKCLAHGHKSIQCVKSHTLVLGEEAPENRFKSVRWFESTNDNLVL